MFCKRPGEERRKRSYPKPVLKVDCGACMLLAPGPNGKNIKTAFDIRHEIQSNSEMALGVQCGMDKRTHSPHDETNELEEDDHISGTGNKGIMSLWVTILMMGLHLADHQI